MPVTVVGLGSNLIVRDSGVPGMVIRLGRGFNESWSRRGIACAPAPRCPTSRSRAPPRRPDRRAVVLAWHSRLDRRRAAHERRRLWRRDQGRACRGARRRPRGRIRHLQPMPTWTSPIAIAACPRTSSSLRRCSRAGRRPAVDRRRDGQDHRKPRGDAADQEPHRRIDLQESARAQGLATHRRRRLPRPRRGGAQVSAMHCNFLINLGGASASRHRELGRNRARARQGQFRRRARMGNQADRRCA